VAEFKRIERALVALDDLDTAGQRKYLPPEVRRAQVLDLVADRPEGYRRRDLADVLGLTKARAGQIVHGLIEDQLLEEHGGGRLVITEEAEQMRRHPEQPEVVFRQGPWEAVDDR
jgi:hypothetical protein